MFVVSICHNDVHEEVREIAVEAMKGVEKKKAKTLCEAEPICLRLRRSSENEIRC
jgi:hypothetical protein